ncbi:MAG: protein-L-isoaspartate(D-aspartate) O-methyltransferase [Burkholderiaceae bacterium]
MGLDSSRVRDRMIQRIAAQGTDHPAVLSALASVERHRFVDSALVNQAYEDTSLPIGLGQTISKPSVVARMLALLLEHTAAPLGRVLEIGTGCGYQAAVLSFIAGEVYSMERLKGLHDKARANLRSLQRPNIHLLFGDGFAGYPTGGPYAAIISAAGGVSVPQTWIDQLAIGGRLVAPTQTPGGQQSLVVIDKTSTGVVKQVLEPVLFVPLKSGVG